MNVQIINKEEVKELFSHWGNFAKVCYDTTTNKPEIVGKHCFSSGHFSGSRSRYIEILITDVPRFVIDQCVRAEVGVVKNVQSFRYVGKNSFCYEVPSEITDNEELLKKYHGHMKSTLELYEEIQTYVYDKVFEKTGSKEKAKERANEQARYIVPMSTHSSFVIGFTLEALIHYCNIRLCTRTEDVHRQMAVMIKNAVLEQLPELKDVLVPNCKYLMWCPEGKKCCGAAPTKNELIERLNNICQI